MSAANSALKLGLKLLSKGIRHNIKKSREDEPDDTTNVSHEVLPEPAMQAASSEQHEDASDDGVYVIGPVTINERVRIVSEAVQRSSRDNAAKHAEIMRRVEAGELPRFMPTLAADPDKEHCRWKTRYSLDDESSFDTACGFSATWGGRPMLGGSKCGHCGRKIVVDEKYIDVWKTTHEGYEWKYE
jgi:hypothetical protein